MGALTTSQDGRELSADTILELLANRRRRYLLYALRGQDGPIELSKLAERDRRLGTRRSARGGRKNEYKSVYVSSVQCHVPKLADAGVVDHDENNHTVVLADNYEQLEPYLRIVIRDEPENSRLHAALETESGDGFQPDSRERGPPQALTTPGRCRLNAHSSGLRRCDLPPSLLDDRGRGLPTIGSVISTRKT